MCFEITLDAVPKMKQYILIHIAFTGGKGFNSQAPQNHTHVHQGCEGFGFHVPLQKNAYGSKRSNYTTRLMVGNFGSSILWLLDFEKDRVAFPCRRLVH